MKEKFEIIVNDCVDDIAPQCCFSPVADFNLNFLSRVRMMHGIDIQLLSVRPSVCLENAATVSKSSIYRPTFFKILWKGLRSTFLLPTAVTRVLR